jgi:calmodulin
VAKMGLGVPESVLVEYQDAFASFDKGGNGMVPTKLLGPLLRAVGENPSEAEIQDMGIEVDVSTSGFFKFPNFLDMMARKMDEISAEDEIREAFKVFDSNGDGFINRQELGYVMDILGLQMDKDEIEGQIDEIDIDGDGQINYEEFYNMMSSK